MSRAAYERVVERVMNDPTVRESGMSEDDARRTAGRAAERADRTPQRTPLTQAQLNERAANVKPFTKTVRQSIDKGSEAHFHLSHADGTAPPRVGLHGRVTDEGRQRIVDMHVRTNQRLKEMLERG